MKMIVSIFGFLAIMYLGVVVYAAVTYYQHETACVANGGIQANSITIKAITYTKCVQDKT